MKQLEEVSLKNYSTFKTDVRVRNMIFLENEKDFVSDELKKATIKEHYIVGEGSNTLFASRLVGTAIVIRNKGIEILEENDSKAVIRVQAGENWNDFVLWSIDNGFVGLQNLIDIPGTVGASPIQNIGAYGVEVKEYIKEVTVVDIPLFITRSLTNSECRFGYRDSIFKNKLKDKVIIKSVTFELEKYKGKIDKKYLLFEELQNKQEGKDLTPLNIMNAIRELRKETVSIFNQYGTCENVFQNIEILHSEYTGLQKKFPGLPKFETEIKGTYKIPTAYIFEKLGWKGRREGDVGTWTYHPLMIVNYGNATGVDIYKFINTMKDDFEENTGISLYPEINIFIDKNIKFKVNQKK